MILGQFNLIHIPFSYQIYFNIMVFYNPTDSACDCHTKRFPHQQYATFLFLFILPGQTENAMVYLYHMP